MNYLKKYRQEAGLVRTSNENVIAAERKQMAVTPTKETLLYLRDTTNNA